MLHLKSRKLLVNFGSYYTPPWIVKLVWRLIQPFIDEKSVIFDPACGYGVFLKEKTLARKVGNDIDLEALKVAKTQVPDATLFSLNALLFYKRKHYEIGEGEKLIIIGNPPYNDTTSQAKKRLKGLSFEVSSEIKSRDVGISFLRAFYHLRADYVCILHPLSYLIKRANFRLLREFKDSYRLLDAVIISSREFNFTSRASEFPIAIALYKRDERGMDFSFVENYPFETIDGKRFKLSDFDYIGEYLQKYPKRGEKLEGEKLLFYTLRDVNALKRNKTFLEKPTANAVKIDIRQLDYYVYVDVFKDFINRVPYYFGNLDIPLKDSLFKSYKDFFISYALRKRTFLKRFYPKHEILNGDSEKVEEYFRKLLGEHYVESERR